MRLAAILRQVPDVVEELVVAEDGKRLAEDALMYVTNEADEHALEQALILKARHGATLTVVSAGGDEARDALATAVAKGADEPILVPLPFEFRGDNLLLAAFLAPVLKEAAYDLILTGVWASDQMDAGLAGLLAQHLGLPYVGGLTSAVVDEGAKKVTARKEFSGGRLGVVDIGLPAILGIVSAEQPPRYVPVSKVMQAKRTLKPRELKGPFPEVARVHPSRLMKPETGAKAEMLAGEPDQVADRIVRLLGERGLL